MANLARLAVTPRTPSDLVDVGPAAQWVRTVQGVLVPADSLSTTVFSQGQGEPDVWPDYEDADVFIDAGQSWSAAFSGRPAGTVYGIGPGVHSPGDITSLIRDGDVLVGPSGTPSGSLPSTTAPLFPNGTPAAIIDGGWDGVTYNNGDGDAFGGNSAGGDAPNATAHFIDRAMVDDIVLKNLEIRRYGCQAQSAAVQPPDADFNPGQGLRWIFYNVAFREIHGQAFRFSNQGGAYHILVDDIGQLGVSCYYQSDWEFKYFEIRDCNRLRMWDAGWEAGATKWTWSSGSLAQHGWVHNNGGYGWWYDLGMQRDPFTNGWSGDHVVEDIDCSYNAEAGITYEACWNVITRRAKVYRNIYEGGPADGTGGAGVFVRVASGRDWDNPLLIEDCVIGFNDGWAEIWIEDRSGVSNKPPDPEYIWTRRNKIYRRDWDAGQFDRVNGMFESGTESANWNTSLHRHEDNEYHVSPSISGADIFAWSPNRTFASWQSLGFDVNSTLDTDIPADESGLPNPPGWPS